MTPTEFCIFLFSSRLTECKIILSTLTKAIIHLPTELKRAYWKPGNWPILFGLGILRLLSFLPLRVLRRIGRSVGRLLYKVSRRRRHIARVNLQLCFPEMSPEKRQQLLVEVFENTGMGLLELAWCWYASIPRLEKSFDIHGLEYIHKAQQQGHGVLLLSFHLTSLELGGTMLATRQKDIIAMYRPHKNPIFEHAMTSGRARVLEPVDRTNIRKVVSALKKKKVVWYAADQNYGIKQGVFVPFFGIPAATITATSWFAKKGNAIVIPMTHRRSEKGMEITIHPPFENFPSGDDTLDAITNMAFLENYLKQYPADYMWVHRRFKTRPEGESGVY